MYQTILNMYDAILSIPTLLVQAFNAYMIANVSLDLITVNIRFTLFSETPIFTMNLFQLTQIIANGIFVVGVVVLTFKIIKRFWGLLKFK